MSEQTGPEHAAAPCAAMFWRRLDTPGHDAVWLANVERSWVISGATVFRHAGGPAALNYRVVCTERWETVSGEIAGRLGDRPIHYKIARGPAGWELDGEPVPGLEALMDLDLSFTPATNLIQLRRVETPVGRRTPIEVAWFDIDAGALAPLPQVYQRLDAGRLAYEAPSVGYQGVLELAESGFIAHYPGLWRAEDG